MFCNDCKDKTCIKSKKPCKTVEDYLRARGIYSRTGLDPSAAARNGKTERGNERDSL